MRKITIAITIKINLLFFLLIYTNTASCQHQRIIKERVIDNKNELNLMLNNLTTKRNYEPIYPSEEMIVYFEFKLDSTGFLHGVRKISQYNIKYKDDEPLYYNMRHIFIPFLYEEFKHTQLADDKYIYALYRYRHKEIIKQ